MSGPDIFISYSREERQAARHFAECFAEEGFAVWWDAALRSGETFDEVIERELRAAKAVKMPRLSRRHVLLWTKPPTLPIPISNRSGKISKPDR